MRHNLLVPPPRLDSADGASDGADVGAAEGRGPSVLVRLLAVAGPGLMVMLADTDAGSVITAAQSGARFGYQLIALQLVLIPILYVIQEMTTRLGLATGQGHGALIRATFGARWALLSALTLFVTCTGALMTQFAGIAGVGGLLGWPRWASIGAATVLLLALLLAGHYRRIEIVGIAIGALELAFIPAAILAHPDPAALLHGLTHPLRADREFLFLVAANVGTTVIPWMIFYQQQAVIDKGHRGLTLRQAVRSARLDTAFGAVVCQLVTCSIIIAIAATIGVREPGANLNTIGEIAAGLAPIVGGAAAIVLFGLGMTGAALLAAMVVSLAGAWGLSEVLGWRHSLNDTPRHAVRFYALIAASVLAGALLVLSAPSLVKLSVDVGVLNACLLPVVLAFLLALEYRALPEHLRMRGIRRVLTYVLAGVVMLFGSYTAVQAVLHV